MTAAALGLQHLAQGAHALATLVNHPACVLWLPAKQACGEGVCRQVLWVQEQCTLSEHMCTSMCTVDVCCCLSVGMFESMLDVPWAG